MDRCLCLWDNNAISSHITIETARPMNTAFTSLPNPPLKTRKKTCNAFLARSHNDSSYHFIKSLHDPTTTVTILSSNPILSSRLHKDIKFMSKYLIWLKKTSREVIGQKCMILSSDDIMLASKLRCSNFPSQFGRFDEGSLNSNWCTFRQV